MIEGSGRPKIQRSFLTFYTYLSLNDLSELRSLILAYQPLVFS